MNLDFRIGSIPVRIEPAFWFMTLILGYTGGRPNVALLALWIVIVFVSVLMHELGHAFMGIAFGLKPYIALHGFGGTTAWEHRRVSRTQSVLISLAGPFTGIVLGGLLWLSIVLGLLRLDLAPELAKGAAAYFIVANVYWGALNLLPILPLDGGNVMMQLVSERPARIVSVVVATAVGVFALVSGYLFGAALAGLFVWQNLRSLLAGRVGT